MNDRDLLLRLRRGDSDAFDTIFREWYPRVVQMAERVVRDRAVAEELAQDVLLELWRRREVLAADSTIPAYLLQSARNRALNFVRHTAIERRSEPEIVAQAGSSMPTDSRAEASELAVAIQEAIVGLPPRCREVFELSRVRGLKYAEIAESLGVSVKAVEAQMGKALRTLREKLAPWMPDADAS